MTSKIRIALLIGVPIAVIVIAVLVSGAAPVFAKGSVIVKLTDEETGRPIGRVDEGYVRVMIGGKDQGYLTDIGELMIKDVEAGTNELVLIIPKYGEKRQYIEVGAGQTVSADIVVDMPNPVFDVSASCNTGWGFFDEYGDISVTLSNRGDVSSMGTSVLVIVHREDNPSFPIATHIFDFPSLVPRKDGGISHTENWRCSEFVWGTKEIISVVVFDGWQYTPQNEQVVTEISLPNSIATEVANAIANYLANNPDKVIDTICKISISWFG